MRNVFIGIAAVLVVIAAIAPLLIAFLLPDWIPGMQAVAVAYVSAFACVGAILFIVLVGLLALIAFQLKNNVVPLLEKATDTMHTVQGTTTFVSVPFRFGTSTGSQDRSPTTTSVAQRGHGGAGFAISLHATIAASCETRQR